MNGIAAFLRYLGRQLFAWADRIAPDYLTIALDAAYKARADADFVAALRREADELRAIRDELNEIAGRPAPFTRNLRSVR